MDRRILHLDIDAFLASLEQLRDPTLRGRPVAVGSGCVASRSYEAKARGVHTAMAMREARQRCPDLQVRDGDARLAERFRQTVAEVLRRFAPAVEICSLDDMYADLTGVPLRVEQAIADPTAAEGERSLVPLCRQIRAAVRDATGLSVSQGLGSTRTVARLATTRAKPGGICEVPAGRERAFLDDFPVQDLPGIGPRRAESLQQMGIATVRQLAGLDRELLRRTFGAVGDEIWCRAHGLDVLPVRDQPLLQSISRETSFASSESTPEQQRSYLRAMLGYLVDRAASELRRLCRCARTVEVRVRFVDGHPAAVARSLREAADRTDAFATLAFGLLDGLLVRRVLVRLVGVTLGGLGPRPARQGVLFDDGAGRRAQLSAAVDALRARHGFGALVVGESIGLLGQVPHGEHGFVLRTPSLAK